MAVNGIVNTARKDVSSNLINELKFVNGKKNGIVHNLKSNHLNVSEYLKLSTNITLVV